MESHLVESGFRIPTISYFQEKYTLRCSLASNGRDNAQETRCKPFDKVALKSRLESLRALTIDTPSRIQSKIIEHCRQVGVAVTFVTLLSYMTAISAIRWLAPEKALIQLSTSYNSDDHFWSTFFRACWYLLMYRRKTIFLDEGRDYSQGDSASEFAERLLIPRDDMRSFLDSWEGDEESIVRFARCVGVAPGLVVGQLERLGQLTGTIDHFKKFPFELKAYVSPMGANAWNSRSAFPVRK